MKKQKGYNKLHEKNRLLGLEFFDLLILILFYLVLFIFSKNLIANLVILLIVYLFLIFYKKGKPPHWWESVIRFLLTPKTYCMRNEKDEETFQ